MLRRWCCQADVILEIEPVDPILIKSGYATVDGADMVPVSTYRNGRPVYYLPGTSLKGVLRSHFERVARSLRPGSVCVPYLRRDRAVPVEEERESYGCGDRERGRDDPASVRYADSCAACRLFGSLKFAGRFNIGDAYPLDDNSPTLDSRNGVGIDRFTGGTARGVLFDLQVLVGGRFQTRIRLINYELWQLAALRILLGDLADEMIAVGSGRSRGLGRVRGGVTSFQLAYLKGVPAVVGLGQVASPAEREAYGLHTWAPPETIPLAVAAQIRGIRQVYEIGHLWSQQLQPLVPALEHFLEWHGGPGGGVADGCIGKGAIS